VTQEFAALVEQYGCTEVVGDNYSADWVATTWRAAGLAYQRSERNKSAIYLEALPLFTRGLISLPNHAQLLRELRLLERRTHRSGKDTVDHGPRGNDDHANAMCGCAVLVAGNSGRYAYPTDDHGEWMDNRKPADVARAFLNFRMNRHVAMYGGRRW
jgi:hypothetical protein